MIAHERARSEWLEADGLGGFASGTVDGIRTRRYHAVLLHAAVPPTRRFVLVNGFEAWLETPGGTIAVSSQVYDSPAGDVLHPDGFRRAVGFAPEPWPAWQYDLGGGARLEHELLVAGGMPVTLLSWKMRRAAADAARLTAVPGPEAAAAGGEPPAGPTVLCVRLLLSGRDYHALHHENSAFGFDPAADGRVLVWHPYDGVPAVAVLSNGAYVHDPVWFRNFAYEEERARGLDWQEDLASPGILRFAITRREALLVLAAVTPATQALLRDEAPALATFLRNSESDRRAAFASPLHRAAAAYVVQRGTGKTIVAGYPWFTDWGRDTFIALRGLCLAAGRLDDARLVLCEWSRTVSDGMLPNRFPDGGEAPEYNSVDASLWFVIAVAEFSRAVKAAGGIPAADLRSLHATVREILTAYAGGTRYGIGAGKDGLLAAGEAGSQLTWMDATSGGRAVTPRIGKPVEVQALWLNALWFGSTFQDRWRRLYAVGCDTFERRFWNERTGCLYDVVDANREPGKADPSVRPNQILAVGGLPVSLMDGKRARQIVDVVEQRLWTPLGLRSLAPDDQAYEPRYEGGPAERDHAYHQGTVWPWLAGAFVDAWVRVRGATPQARQEARLRFLQPLLGHLGAAGLGHLPEIADGEAPHTPRGCPFQAWSVGELLRLREVLLVDPAPASRAPRETATATPAGAVLRLSS